MFDRNFEVARHTRRQSDRGRVCPAHPMVFRLQQRERPIRLPVQRRYSHQAHQLKGFGGVGLRADFVDGTGVGDIYAAPGHVTVEEWAVVALSFGADASGRTFLPQGVAPTARLRRADLCL